MKTGKNTVSPLGHPPASGRDQGYTLIEIGVVLVIVGILAAFAIPSYLDQQRETNRADAKSTLTSLAASMEQTVAANNFYSDILAGGTYNCTTTSVTLPATYCPSMPKISCPASDGKYYSNLGYYTVSITLLPAGATCYTGYLLTATVNSSSTVSNAKTTQKNDTKCNKFTLDNLGTRIAYDSTGAVVSPVTTCW